MKQINHSLVTLAVMAGLMLTACQKHGTSHHAEHPAEVKKIEGTDLSTVTLTEQAMQRLDVKTDQVREASVKRSSAPRQVVPYSALIYDQKGQTWVYTSPQPRTFVRHKIDVDYIEGDVVILNDGPPKGTIVASVAVAELYGAEFKVGH